MNPWKWVGGIAAAAGAATAVLWGVPSYIEKVVRERVTAELTVQGVSAISDKVTDNGAKLTSIETTMNTRFDSIETRMIARDELFMVYLQSQTN